MISNESTHSLGTPRLFVANDVWFSYPLEIMNCAAPLDDVDRFAMIFPQSPRQSDVIIIARTFINNMAPPLRKVSNDMREPRWDIFMGSCPNGGYDHDT